MRGTHRNFRNPCPACLQPAAFEQYRLRVAQRILERSPSSVLHGTPVAFIVDGMAPSKNLAQGEAADPLVVAPQCDPV